MTLSLLVECLLQNFLATSTHCTSLALLLPYRELTEDSVPAPCCAVLAETPFLELSLVLAFAVVVIVVSATCSKFAILAKCRTSS
jgi:hypothetical protein